MSSHNKTFIECTLYLEMHLKCCTLDLKFEHSYKNTHHKFKPVKSAHKSSTATHNVTVSPQQRAVARGRFPEWNELQLLHAA